MDNDRLLSGAAWRDFCRRLEGLGERLGDAEFPGDRRGSAEGYRHLTRQLVYALQWYVELRNPRFPGFHRYDDDVTKWGGPCVDFNYLRAHVSAEHTYRISGDLRGVRQMLVSLPEGEMAFDQLGVFGQWSIGQLGVGPDGQLNVLLAAERPADYHGTWLPLDPRADHVLVRIVVSDWAHDAVPQLRIERLGSAGEAPPPLEPAEMEARLDAAMTWIERSVPFWCRYTTAARARVGDNCIEAPRRVAGGASDFQYASGFWHLGDAEALIVEVEAVDAPYWSIHFYTPGWFESGDLANRSVSYTGHTTHVDSDGRCRFVFAHHDPGVPNWIDTEGRPRGQIALRWGFLDRPAPVPTARLVRRTDLRRALPGDHPLVDAVWRAARLGERQEAAARRFRH